MLTFVPTPDRLGLKARVNTEKRTNEIRMAFIGGTGFRNTLHKRLVPGDGLQQGRNRRGAAWTERLHADWLSAGLDPSHEDAAGGRIGYSQAPTVSC
jgi:hypothetical protein